MTVPEILEHLRKTCGDSWAEDLAAEMTGSERDALREVIERKDGAGSLCW